jgi:hypothetical protein
VGVVLKLFFMCSVCSVFCNPKDMLITWCVCSAAFQTDWTVVGVYIVCLFAVSFSYIVEVV